MVCEDEYTRWKLLNPLPKEHPLAQDPIKYWWQIQIKFPRLAQFAFNILTIPATSSDCERGFSKAGDLLKPRQSRLQPMIITALQCTRSWKKMGYKKAGREGSKPINLYKANSWQRSSCYLPILYTTPRSRYTRCLYRVCLNRVCLNRVCLINCLRAARTSLYYNWLMVEELNGQYTAARRSHGGFSIELQIL